MVQRKRKAVPFPTPQTSTGDEDISVFSFSSSSSSSYSSISSSSKNNNYNNNNSVNYPIINTFTCIDDPKTCTYMNNNHQSKRKRRGHAVPISCGLPSCQLVSWPFRKPLNGGENCCLLQCGGEELGIEAMKRLKGALKRDFPYVRVIPGLTATIRARLMEKKLWLFLIRAAQVYTGSSRSHRQKYTEIAFAAWTTLVRFYGKCEARGEGQFLRLALAAVLLQAKLLEEADVDMSKLEKHRHFPQMASFDRGLLEASERRIAEVLGWKLLVPSPQVILFLCLDVIGAVLAVPMKLKLLVARTLDRLIEDFVLQECLGVGDVNGVFGLVLQVLEGVLTDFFGGNRRSLEILRESIKSMSAAASTKSVSENFNCVIDAAVKVTIREVEHQEDEISNVIINL